jgi:uncharacterized glyoxalase superfamily protein PhnB
MAIHEVFPSLRVSNAAAAIEFYVRVFGAKEKFRLVEPSGRIGHVELELGPVTLMLSDEFPEYGIRAPGPDGVQGANIHLHVDDADAWIRRAVEAGARLIREPQNQFYGERSGTVRDPFGHEWHVGHSIEQVSPEEMQRRYTQMLGGA